MVINMRFAKITAAALSAILVGAQIVSCGSKDKSGDGYDYSNGLDSNGFFTGVKASDYVELPKYKGIDIDASILEASEEDIQAQLDGIISQSGSYEKITDRAVEDGDTINIDYVGKVDGVEFEGGSTGGEGTEVTIGVTSYIDDFLEQLIGHKVGETFDINVTFPDPYERDTTLSGKEATFTVTINHIIVTRTYELTDDFVEKNLKDTYGYTSVENMRETIAKDLRDSQVYTAMMETILENCPVSEVPQKLVDNEITIVMKQLKYTALQYSMEVSTLLTYYYGVDSEEAFRTNYEEQIRETISQYMVMMAIAEDANLFATEDDLKEYFKNEMSVDDYSDYVAQYGYGYLYRAVTFNNVGTYLQEQNPAPSYTDINEIIVPATTDEETPAEDGTETPAEENTETPAA